MDPITGRSAGGGWKLDRLINWSAAATITTTCACTPMFPVLWDCLVPKPFGSINTTCACTPNPHVHLAPEPLVQSITTISACSTPLCSQFCLVPKPFGTINHHMCLHPQSPSSHVPRSVGSSCARTFDTITILPCGCVYIFLVLRVPCLATPT